MGRFPTPLAADVHPLARRVGDRARHTDALAFRRPCDARHRPRPRRGAGREIRHRIVARRHRRGTAGAFGSGDPPTVVHVPDGRGDASDLLFAHLSGQALPRRPAAGSGRRGAHRLGDAAGIPLHRADPPAAPPGKEAEAGIKAAVRNRGPKPLRRGTEQFRIFFVILENFRLCLIQRTLEELPDFEVMTWQLCRMLRSALNCFQVTRFCVQK